MFQCLGIIVTCVRVHNEQAKPRLVFQYLGIIVTCVRVHDEQANCSRHSDQEGAHAAAGLSTILVSILISILISIY